MRTMKSADAISGSLGRAYVKIDNNNEEMFFAKAIKAQLEKAKGDVKTIGRRMVGHKAGAINGTGSATIYYVSPLFRSMLQKYKNGGGDIYFDMVIENDDPASAAGKQAVLLMGVNLDGLTLSQLDGDSDDPLEEEVNFTFEDFEILQEFNKI